MMGVDTHAGISTRFRGDASLQLQSAERIAACADQVM